jgi:hypothetical protein
VEGVYDEDTGLCEYTRPDGDKVFLTYEAAGKVGASVKGTGSIAIAGGTGKWKARGHNLGFRCCNASICEKTV